MGIDRHKFSGPSLCLCASVVLLAGCTVHPRGESEERQHALEAARSSQYQRPFENRNLPELKPDATPEELVRYALLASGDVEAKYWDWRSALEQVPQEGTQKSGTMLSYNLMIASGMTALGDSTLGVGNDTTSSLMLPSKLGTQAAAALEQARAAGWRFDAARFALRNKVLAAWYEYAMTAELARLEEANSKLLDLMEKATESRVANSTAMQQDLLKAANEVEMSRNEAAAKRAKLPAQRAMLNALLNRPSDAPLAEPAVLPAPRPLTEDDAALLSAATTSNPELAALGREIAGKKDALQRAKLEYLPDFNVNFSTDLAGVTQNLMSSVMLPYLRYQAIDAGIRQAEANLRAAQAMQRQTQHDVAARVVEDLTVLRDAQRQVDLFEKTIIPRAQRVITAAQNSYANGQTPLVDLLDSQRSLIALRRMVTEFRIEREKRLADLEEAAGRELATH